MQNTSTTPAANPSTVLGRIGRDPSRLMTVREWWHEMGEPVEMLIDPEAAYAEDERELIELCRQNGIDYREPQPASRSHSASLAGEGREAAFPAWLLLQFYPFNL